MTKDNLLIYVCATGGQAPEWIQILPMGKVELRDGRQPFEVTKADLEAIIAKFKAEGVDLVVDYEHQSLGGDKAPAAGWIKELQARDDGLYARVEWTAAARRHIEAKEYLYYSPVLKLSPQTRRPLALMHAALTNTPAMTQLAPLLAAKYGEGKADIIVLNSPVSTPAPQPQEEATAMLKKLIEKFGLTPEATEAEVLALVDSRAQEAVALKAQVTVLPEIAAALGLEANADASKIKGTILALKQGQEQLTGLQTEVTALKTAGIQAKAEKAVEEALKVRKITPAQTAWALEYASRDLEGFKAFVKTAAPVLATETLKIKTEDGKGETSLTADELAMCKVTGVAPEAFKATQIKLAEGQA